MTDLDAALAAPGMVGVTGRAPGRRCKVRIILDEVTPTQRAAILERLYSDGAVTGWTDAALSQALDRGGRYVAASQLSRHRTRACVCSTHDDTNEAR